LTVNIIRFIKLDDRAVKPKKSTPGSAAFDMYAVLDSPVEIAAGGKARIPTGIALEQPDSGWVSLLFSRSGMGAEFMISLSNSVGVIDSDYRGEIVVSLKNSSNEVYTVNPGDRVAQLLPIQIPEVSLVEVEELNETKRSDGGFGSTGS
jgi:dUTP pyrophosphatase